MNVEELKADREQLHALRSEEWQLRLKRKEAVDKARRSGGVLYSHKYGGKWDIDNVYTGDKATVSTSWINSHGTDEQKKMVRDRYYEIERSICAEESKKADELYEEIKTLKKGYEPFLTNIFEGEDPRYDGENDLEALLLFAQRILEVVK